MPHATADDGLKLYYEETGAGRLVIFVHEFAGSYRSWEPQMRHFGRRYRCVSYAARGYPPSDVPEDPASYAPARAADEAHRSDARSDRRRGLAVLDAGHPDETIDPVCRARRNAEFGAHDQHRGAEQFNRVVGEFLAQVDGGRWPNRDPRSQTASITGMKS